MSNGVGNNEAAACKITVIVTVASVVLSPLAERLDLLGPIFTLPHVEV